MNITVLGAGNWGMTAALLLHGNGHSIRVWEFNEKYAESMRRDHENKTFLPGFPIPEDVHVTSNLADALIDAELAVFAVPSSYMRDTAKSAANTGALGNNTLCASLSKGLEYATISTMTEIIADETGGNTTVALSGPCIADEVAHGLPTTIVSASEDIQAAECVRDAFMNQRFRVYTSPDPLGVQLGGALKNIIAMSAGILDGFYRESPASLGSVAFGTNAKSALVTRGIVEIIRFGTSLGAQAATFTGLSGIGDLITTCFSGHSRNRHVGEELGRGRTLDDILGDMVMVAEGIPTTRAVYAYAREHGIDMPITEMVHEVMYSGLAPKDAVDALMSREPKPERMH